MTRPLIALDGDGVLLDYSTAYAKAWERAFGYHPVEQDASAYWPMARWGVELLTGARLERFRACVEAALHRRGHFRQQARIGLTRIGQAR